MTKVKYAAVAIIGAVIGAGGMYLGMRHDAESGPGAGALALEPAHIKSDTVAEKAILPEPTSQVAKDISVPKATTAGQCTAVDPRLLRGVTGVARAVSDQPTVPEQDLLSDVERKTKSPAEPAVHKVIDMKKSGASERKLLEYAGANIKDKLQEVVVNAWIRNQFHRDGAERNHPSSLGAGGGPALVPKPTLIRPGEAGAQNPSM